MLKLLISCWYDGVVVACRYMFVMGSDVVLVLLLLYCVWAWDFNYFNKLKFYSVIWKSVHVLVIIVNCDNMHGEKLKKKRR